MNAFLFWIHRFSRRLLVRASFYAVFAVAVALIAVQFAPFVPTKISDRLGGEAVEGILSALATSLLAVTTFSASAVVVAYTSASAQLTPRATSFITADVPTQRALATFIGGFLFTIVTLVALGANYYGPGGRTIIFVATLLMVVIVSVTLLRWIDQVSRLALHSRLLQQIEAAAAGAFEAREAKPFLGGAELKQPSPNGAVLIASKSGYISNIDPGQLQKAAETLDCTIEILHLPGAFIHRGDVLLRLPECAAIADDMCKSLSAAFAIDDTRTFEQDPEYGLQVLVEAAARALSPGINDPGTAILATDSCYRLLGQWIQSGRAARVEAVCSRLKAPALDCCALVRGSLGEIARYGAHDVLVAERIQRALTALAAEAEDAGLTDCIRGAAKVALARAESAMAMDVDKDRVRAAADLCG